MSSSLLEALVWIIIAVIILAGSEWLGQVFPFGLVYSLLFIVPRG